MKFNLLGNTVIIPEDRVRYNELKNKYTQIAYESEMKFRNVYKNNNKNIDDVVNNVFNQGNEIIERTVIRIEEINFNKISIDSFIENYYLKYLLGWQESCNEIYDKYMDIVLNEVEKEAYRKYRKNTRGRWQGGGFGLKGAINGAVQAGALNMASGMAHSAFNMAGKAMSKVKTSYKKSKLYRDKSTLDNLSEELNNSIFNLHLAIKEYIQDNTDIKIRGVSKTDILIVGSKLQQIVDGEVDDSKKLDELIEIINIYPYSVDVYKYMVQEFGDRNKEIEKISNYFGCDIRNYKENILNEKFKNLKTDTEEAAKNTRKIIIEEIQKLGLDENHKIINTIDKKLKEHDEYIRTVNGIIFETREEANIAKLESEKIKDIISRINMEERQSLIQGINLIQGLSLETNIAESYLTSLSSKLQDIELELKTIYIKPLTRYEYIKPKNSEIKKIILDTVEEAELAIKEQKLIKKWYDDSDDKSLKKLIVQIDSQINTRIKEEYIKQIENEINKLIKINTYDCEEYKKKIKYYRCGLVVYLYFAICAISDLFVSENFNEMVGIITVIGFIGVFLMKKFIKINDNYKQSKFIIDSLTEVDKESKINTSVAKQLNKEVVIISVILISIVGVSLVKIMDDKSNNNSSKIESENKLNYEQENNYEDKEYVENESYENIEEIESIVIDESISEDSQQSKKEEYIQKLDSIETEVSLLSYDGSTLEMKETSIEVLKKWDDALNGIYGVLKSQLSSSEMESLKEEQIQWIATRDANAEESASEFEGGTMYDLAYTEVLGQLTKERCYELVEIYMK